MNYIHVGEPNAHGIRRRCSDAVLGSAARHILNGDLPTEAEHDCCRVARSQMRLCWHQAARILLGNGLHPRSTHEYPRRLARQDDLVPRG
jgi:hypothetical protein